MLFVDLDDFKPINDALGHHSGDRLFVEVAKRLKTCLREADTAARIGGDEFTVLLEDVADVSEALKFSERFQRQLLAPLDLQEHSVYTSASIGMALGAEEQPEELLRAADLAMYQAKRTGKAHSVEFAPSK